MIGDDDAIKNLPEQVRCREVFAVLMFSKKVMRRCRNSRGVHQFYCAKHRIEVQPDHSGDAGKRWRYHKLIETPAGLRLPSTLRREAKRAKWYEYLARALAKAAT